MPYKIDLSEDEGIVVITNTGRLTYESIEKMSLEALEIARSNNARLFLSDCTSLSNPIGVLEAYKIPELYDEISAQKGKNKLAILLADDFTITEEIRLFETVCVNRGRMVKIFTCKNTAVEWLLS
jgi:hypothetical protein